LAAGLAMLYVWSMRMVVKDWYDLK
jgi:hypothetical protein